MAVKAVYGAPTVDVDAENDYSEDDGIFEVRHIPVFGAPQVDVWRSVIPASYAFASRVVLVSLRQDALTDPWMYS